MQYAVVFALVAIVAAQSGSNNIQCGFTCSRQSSFTVTIDGSFTTARCTDSNADPRTRCAGCCGARALAAGLTTADASGFPSNNNRECVCCINNRRCNNPAPAVPAFAGPTGK